MQNTAIAPQIVKTHCTVTRIVDGDGLFVVDMFGKNETEIRLLGIDAPEVNRCRKLIQDERETHMPGQLLLSLGMASKAFLSSIVHPGDNVSLITEGSSNVDMHRRTLAYVILSNGACLSEMMIREGYAKPYNKYYCSKLNYFQELSFDAKQNKRGLFSEVLCF
jgi:micrococcal nuclease